MIYDGEGLIQDVIYLLHALFGQRLSRGVPGVDDHKRSHINAALTRLRQRGPELFWLLC